MLVDGGAAVGGGHFEVGEFHGAEAAHLPVNSDDIDEGFAFEGIAGLEGEGPGVEEGVEFVLVLRLEDGAKGVDGVFDSVLGGRGESGGGFGAFGLESVEAAGGAAGLGWLLLIRHFVSFSGRGGGPISVESLPTASFAGDKRR